MRTFIRSLFQSPISSASRRHFIRSVVGGAAVLSTASLVGRGTPLTAAIAPEKSQPRSAEPAVDEFDPISDPGWTA